MKPLQAFRFLCLALTLSLLTVAPATAQVTAGEVTDLRARVAADAALAEEDRAALFEQLDNAQSQLEVAAEFRGTTTRLKSDIEQAPSQTTSYEQRLREAQTNATDHAAGISEDSDVEALESQITLVTADRQSLSERLSQLIAEVEGVPARRAKIKRQLVELQAIIDGPPDASIKPEGTLEQSVAWTLAVARKQAALAEKESLETEVLGEPAMSAVGAAERAWLGFAIADVEARLAALNSALKKARASAMREQLATTSQLQEQLQTDDPELEDFAEGNRKLAKQLQDLAGLTDQAKREGKTTQVLLEGIEQDSQLMQRRLQVAGRKEVLGRVMITRMDSLPDTPTIQREISRRNELIATTSLTQIDAEEEFRKISQSRDYAAELVPDLRSLDQPSQNLVRSLVEQRVQLLEDNLKSLGLLLRQLLDNNDRSAALIVAAEDFHRFLLGNLLWVRNFSFLHLGTLYDQLSEIGSPENWIQLPQQMVSGFRALPWSSVLLGALLLSLLLARQMRPLYESLLSQPMVLSSATLWNILGGLALTAILVLPWPLAMYLAGHFLEATIEESLFSSALAPALILTSKVLYLLLFTRKIANRKGVGRRFLKWDARMLDSLRSELNWAGPLICSSVMLNTFAYHLDLISSGGPLGAISLTLSAVTVIVFSFRLLRQEIFYEAAMVKFGLRLSLIIASIVLLLEAMGLLFAAEIYLLALARSVAWLLIIKTVGDTLERWLMILRARIQRDAREQQKCREEKAAATLEEQEAEVDMLSLSEAHGKLLSMARVVATIIALWMIWSPTLPALTLLESIELWQVTDSADPTKDRAVTLIDLLYSIVVIVLTFFITKHLPSLSEVFMREWFNMSPGARYASSILMQYLVIAIGVSLCLTAIGWEWSSVQWLVAALGVGIGFGLQEIVANFISGIIILFERPVRVGDIISAGGAEGVVKKINPRATILETFDRKEHLIPNKELITGQVVNWTLSDGAIRVIIPVGIAYGSDVRLALSLLKEAASEVQNVLPDPEPRSSFEDFGDNSLVLWLRCYISEDRIGTWTELRTLINDKFNKAGIVISFPQRDVHLDTLEPLQVEVRHLGDPSPT